MKTMTCSQLGGTCSMEFHAETFDEMAEMSKKHGMEMAEKSDEAHVHAMEDMKRTMEDPEAMKQWMEEKQNEFNVLPEHQM